MHPYRRQDSDVKPQAARIAKLIAALDEEQHSVRLSAMRKLGEQGASAQPAVPVLGKALRAVQEPERTGGTDTGPDRQGICKGAGRKLAFPGHRRSPARLRALQSIGPDALSAAETVCGLLEHEDHDIRGLAAQALAEMGPTAQPIAPRLAKALRDRDAKVRLLAGQALRELGAANVVHLLPLVSDDNPALRFTAAQLLPLFHERAECLRALLMLGGAKEPQTRQAAAASLVRLGLTAKPAMIDLLKTLKAGDQELAKHSFHALMALGTFDNDCLLDGAATITDETERRRPSPPDQFGQKGQNPVAAVVRAMEDGSDMDRLSAVLALASLRGSAKPALPSLRKALKDQNNGLICAAAIVAIAAIDRGRKADYHQARAAVEEFLGDMKAAQIPNTEDVVHLWIFLSASPKISADDKGAKEFMATLSSARVWARNSMRALPYATGRVPVFVVR